MTARPRWLAYVLTLFAAGLGHLYLGVWKRGALWFATYVVAVVFLSAWTLQEALEPGDPFVVTALSIESVEYWTVAVPLSVLVLCLIDVYAIATLRDDADDRE